MSPRTSLRGYRAAHRSRAPSRRPAAVPLPRRSSSSSRSFRAPNGAGLLLRDAPSAETLGATRIFGLAFQYAPLGVLLSMLAFRKGDALPFDSFSTLAQCRDTALRRLLVGVLSAIGALLLLDSGLVSSSAFAEGSASSARWGSEAIERIPGFEKPSS